MLRSLGRSLCAGLAVLLAVGCLPFGAHAQSNEAPFVLTLDRAVQVALENNFTLEGTILDVKEADAQVREVRGQVLPQVNVTGSYTRNVVNANPFAGSDLSSIFGGGSQADWVAFNEQRRQDNDPSTAPISFDAFQQRQADSLAASGVNLASGGNPFGVDNEFLGAVEVTQTLYNGSAFSALRGAKQFREVSRLARKRETKEVANAVYEAFYQALLAEERARVVSQRLERTEKTLQEIRAQVRQGTAPKFQRLGAEVERSNIKTELIQARNDADRAVDNLKRTLGLDAETPVRLDGTLERPSADGLQQISMSDAVARAFQERADLRRARVAIELEDIRRNTVRSEYFPTLSAFANVNYTGRVPDDRTQIITNNPNDLTDPFFFDSQERGFFNDEFWNPSFSVGVRMQWNIFNGFQTSSRMQQRAIAIDRAKVQAEQLQQAIAIEVRSALRSLTTAQQRIQSQLQNVDRAETNYAYTAQRVGEGVSSPLELREASDQLDQSRLNYLQAVFDYLVARSDLQTAMGMPLSSIDDDLQMTQR